eukprot:5061630-Heterocapsa_arctica.AAC.1
MSCNPADSGLYRPRPGAGTGGLAGPLPVPQRPLNFRRRSRMFSGRTNPCHCAEWGGSLSTREVRSSMKPP